MLEIGMFLKDRYEILENVGSGGMSDVYKAKDHILGREVAIKVLKSEFAEDMSFVTKFRTEAQAAAGLEHPNIVNIYDVGSENGNYFIIMEYVEGITLKTYIKKKGNLNYKEVISIGIQVGRGIGAAHDKGIIHRDIKPQNIIISKEGKVKVTDFGIAKAVTSNTINADVMGSVHYTSPEQARNGYVTCQTDIYSLGIVMYEMATGRVPYDGDTTVAIAIQHLQSEMIAPSKYVEDIPISLEKIIMKCTMKSTDRRYENMEELLLDLKKALVNPEEDFVTINDAGNTVENTRVITEDELEQIKAEAGVVEDEPLVEKDEEPKEGKVNSKMDKAITIMAITAAVVIIGLLVYFVGSFFGLWKFSNSNDTEQSSEQFSMIDLCGLTEKEAIDKLKFLNLGYKKVEASSDKYDQGLVCDQSVKKGEKVSAKTTITITISTGKGDKSIPNVVGMSESNAITALQSAGFKYNKEYKYDDGEQGKVLSQTPSASTKGKEGDIVTIVISQGSEKVKVPYVVGQSQSSAIAALNAAGLQVGSIDTQNNDSVASGNVISQGIESGKSVDKGTKVNLVVSRGAKLYKFSFTCDADGRWELYDANGRQCLSEEHSKGQNVQVSGITTSTGTLAGPSGSRSVSFDPQ